MNPIPKLSETDLKRFWSKVNQNDDCWLWVGALRQTKKSRKLHYGSFKIGGRAGKNYLVHRVSYAIAKGEPGQKEVCHSCDTPLCVNPSHLWTGTQDDNLRDRDEKNHHYKILTIEQVREIFTSCETHHRLGNRYGVSQGTIYDLKTGRTWSRVTGLPKYRKKKA